MTAGAVSVPTVVPLRVPQPGQHKNSIDTNTKIELRSETANSTIYYTINGDKPEPFEAHGPAAKNTYKYKVPFRLPPGKKYVKAVAVAEDGLRESHVVSKTFDVESVPMDPEFQKSTNGLEFINDLVGNDTARREVKKFAANMVDSKTAWQEIQKIRENERTDRDGLITGSNKHKVGTCTRFLNDRMGTSARSDKATVGQNSTVNAYDRELSSSRLNKPVAPESSTQALRLQRQTDFLKCIYCFAPRPADPFARFCNECGNPVAQMTAGRLPPPESGQMGTCVSCHSLVPFNTNTCVICEADIPPQNQVQASIKLAEKQICTSCGTANQNGTFSCVTCENRLLTSSSQIQNNFGKSAPPMPKGNSTALLTCTKCGRANSTDARFCDWCGAKPSAVNTTLLCSKCGASNYAYAAFCSSCGVTIEAPQRPEVATNGLTIRMENYNKGTTSNQNPRWIPVALPTNLSVKNSISTQTVGLFYPSEKDILKKQKEELDKLLLEKSSRDKNPVLTAISPGRGYWRKQMDHICGHLKAHAQNNAEFRSLIAEPKMGKIVSTSVREDGYELSLTVSFALRTDSDPFQGKKMNLKNSEFLSSFTHGRASLRSYNSEDSLISRTSAQKVRKRTTKRVKKKKVQDTEKYDSMAQLIKEVGKNGDGRPSEIEELIDDGADPNGKNKDGIPILHLAVKNSHIDAIPILIENKADVNQRGPNKGNTALHEAVLMGIEALPIIDQLLKNGAKVDRKNEKGHTAYDLAIKSNNDKIAKKLNEKIGQNVLSELSRASAPFDD